MICENQAMTKYSIAVFLLAYGVLGLITTRVPEWVLPIIALASGLGVLMQERSTSK